MKSIIANCRLAVSILFLPLTLSGCYSSAYYPGYDYGDSEPYQAGYPSAGYGTRAPYGYGRQNYSGRAYGGRNCPDDDRDDDDSRPYRPWRNNPYRDNYGR